MNSPVVPPRFVPTLTEVVVPAVQQPAPQSVAALPVVGVSDLEEQLVHRVLQRVDMVLERRLREAIGQVISEHTQALAPRLREEIEGVVRDAVGQAFGQEARPDR